MFGRSTNILQRWVILSPRENDRLRGTPAGYAQVRVCLFAAGSARRTRCNRTRTRQVTGVNRMTLVNAYCRVRSLTHANLRKSPTQR